MFLPGDLIARHERHRVCFAAKAGPCVFATSIDIGRDRVPSTVSHHEHVWELRSSSVPRFGCLVVEWTGNLKLVVVLFADVYLAGAVCRVFVPPSR